MSLIFIISKNNSIKEQHFAVPTALGGQYFNKTLLTGEINACEASLIFIMEYGASLICFMQFMSYYFHLFNFGSR